RLARPDAARLVRKLLAELDRLAVEAQLEHAAGAVDCLALVHDVEQRQVEARASADFTAGLAPGESGQREQDAEQHPPRLDHGHGMTSSGVKRRAGVLTCIIWRCAAFWCWWCLCSWPPRARRPCRPRRVISLPGAPEPTPTIRPPCVRMDTRDECERYYQ